jgi:hypothetical protein
MFRQMAGIEMTHVPYKGTGYGLARLGKVGQAELTYCGHNSIACIAFSCLLLAFSPVPDALR